MKGKWKVLRAKTIFKNDHSHIQTWKVRTHEGRKKDFTMSKGQDFMVMLAVTEKGEMVTIQQHYLNENKKIISLVAGYVETGEKLSTSAHRELREESGYDCRQVVYLGKSIKGKYATGHAHYFLGLDAYQSQEQELEEAEDIDVVLLKPKRFIALLEQGKFLDVYTETCAWRALKYLKLI